MEYNNSSRTDKPTEFLLTPEYESTQVNFCKKSIITELSSDFTLPDYLPEIRKMLGIFPRISPLSRYISTNSAEFSGRMDYDVLYVGSSGKLQFAPLSTDFSFDFQPSPPTNVDFNSSGDIWADTEVDSLHCRVTAQRKMNIKCKLRSLIRAFGYDEGSKELLHGTRGCEKLSKELKTASFKKHMSEVIELSDEVNLPSENAKSVYCFSSVTVNEVTPAEKRLNCRGELISDILYEDEENGRIITDTRKTPFSQDIEIGNDTPLSFNVKGICGETKITDADGKLLLDTDIILEAETLSETSTDVITDMFAPEKQSETTLREFKFQSTEKAASFTAKTEASFPLNSLSIPEDGEIITCRGSAHTERINTEAENCTIEGSCKLWVLIKSGDEYSTSELSLPFSFDTGIKNAEKNLSVICNPYALSCKCRMSGENILCSSDVVIPYCITRENSLMIAEDFSASEEAVKNPPHISIYYPEKGETLWSVAKSYRKSLKNIADANGLPTYSGSEILDSKQFIIIS